MASIFISSTFMDLESHREAAYRALRRLHYDVTAMEDYVAADERPQDRCLKDVAKCDLYIGIIAWRYGYVPSDRNPNRHSITELEYRHAGECGKTRLMFLLRENALWPAKFVDKDQAAKSLEELRRKVAQDHLVSFFSSEHELAELVVTALMQWEMERSCQPIQIRPQLSLLSTAPLRKFRIGNPPVEPYPLLGPYTHPDTFAGRDRETEELERLVGRPRLVLCLYGPSGAGKSSLLMAGLAPRLRANGFPVCLLRDPGEPLLAQRLVAGILDVPSDVILSDEDPGLYREFAGWMARAKALAAGKPPVLILDQLDDFLHVDAVRYAMLAQLGPLMAATAQLLHSESDFCCRWVLSYRHEFHGVVDEWLRDVLAEARRSGHHGLETLPHNLRSEDRFDSWPVPLLGAFDPRGADEAKLAFRAAIERPLMLLSSDGKPKYALRFKDDARERLAMAFAQAREKQPKAPLIPELQVVLRHLIDRAGIGSSGERMVEVPQAGEALQQEIENALAAHLKRALERTFPLEIDQKPARLGRTRALLALRALADAHGLRDLGLTSTELVAAIGTGGEDVLQKLASAEMRLVIQIERNHRTVYVLSHDRMAEVVTKLVEDEAARGGLELDQEVLELRRFVSQRTDLFLRSNDDEAANLTKRQRDLIQSSEDALLWSDDHWRWWEESKTRFDIVQRMSADPNYAFAALVELMDKPHLDLMKLRNRLKSADLTKVFWKGLSSANMETNSSYPDAVLRVIERLYGAFQNDSEMIRAMNYAVEEVFRIDRSKEDRVLTLREILRKNYPVQGSLPPPLFRSDLWFLPDEPLLGFVMIEEGWFLMGSDKNKDASAYDDELCLKPTGKASSESPTVARQAWVNVPTFYINRYPVTVAQFRVYADSTKVSLGYENCLKGEVAHPVVAVSWLEALGYCEWLQRMLSDSSKTPEILKQLLCSGWCVCLASEAEWEKAARGTDGRIYPWGDTISDDCANYNGAGIGKTTLVGAFPRGASPFGVLDMSGNVWEWTRSLARDYPYDSSDGREDLKTDGRDRVFRGGAFSSIEKHIRAAYRGYYEPTFQDADIGFRIVVYRPDIKE